MSEEFWIPIESALRGALGRDRLERAGAVPLIRRAQLGRKFQLSIYLSRLSCALLGPFGLPVGPHFEMRIKDQDAPESATQRDVLPLLLPCCLPAIAVMYQGIGDG